MAIVPVLKCTAIDRSLTHYTGVLDFDLVGVWPGRADPAYALLIRQGLEQNERLKQLNEVAITQMKSLFQMNSKIKLHD
jgi:hypothetical protein